MVEMIVAAIFFLVPLFLVIVALGKFADVQTTTSEAARYAAWERTVWFTDDDWRSRMGSTGNAKSSADIRSEIAQRIVGVTRLTLRADDKTKNSLSNGTLSLWTDSQGKALLENYNDLTLAETATSLSAAQCQACLLPTHLPFPAPFDLGIDVPNNAMVVAAAGMNVGVNSTALKNLFPAYTGWAGLMTKDRVALLPNEWMANGSDGVTKIVKGSRAHRAATVERRDRSRREAVDPVHDGNHSPQVRTDPARRGPCRPRPLIAMTSFAKTCWRHRRAIVLATAVLLPLGAHCACAEHPFAGERQKVVSEQVWVRGMSLTIIELPALDTGAARARFGDFWRKDHRELRVASTSDTEVTSTFKDGCVYALQLPTDAATGMPARLVVSDLHRAQPALPHAFDWPPAAQADVLGDTVSEDGNRVNRLLTYRVSVRAGTAAAQCILRLTQAAWKIAGVTILNDRQVTFSGRKGTAILDAVVAKDGSGSVITMNFTEQDG